MSEETMSKGIVGDTLRAVGKKMGLHRPNEAAITTGPEGHDTHAAQHRAAASGEPTAHAARLAISNGHAHMARASSAFLAGNHTLAAQHANLAAQQHASASGHHPETAHAHGAELRRAVTTMAQHVPGIVGVRAPKVTPARPAAPAASAGHGDLPGMAEQHRSAAQGIRPRGEPSGHAATGTHNALHSLSAAHDHVAQAASALHGGDHVTARTQLTHAQGRLDHARAQDSSTHARRGAQVQSAVAHLHSLMPMSKAEAAPTDASPYDVMAQHFLSTFRR